MFMKHIIRFCGVIQIWNLRSLAGLPQSDYSSDYTYDDDDTVDTDVDSPKVDYSSYNIKIITKPKQIQVAAGTTLRLPCEVDNLAKELYPNVIWTKKGASHTIIATGSTVLGGYTERAKVNLGKQGSSLMITLAQKEDAGQYKCSLELGDNRKEIVHQVTVQGESLIQSISPASIRINKGDDLVLSCNSSEETTASWTRDDGSLQEGRSSQKEGILTLTGIQEEEGGTYSCTARDGKGGEAVKQVEVDVLFPPKVTVSEIVIHAITGDVAQLLCKVSGNPKPSMSWTKNGEGEIHQKDERRKISSKSNKHTLTISNVVEDDLGEYICSANSNLGVDQGVINLSENTASLSISLLPSTFSLVLTTLVFCISTKSSFV